MNEDLGDSLDSVEALLKKHEDFEKSLSAQEEKITVSYSIFIHLIHIPPSFEQEYHSYFLESIRL